jgi:hypothetical protein
MDDPKETRYSEITEANTIFKQAKPWSDARELESQRLKSQQQKRENHKNSEINNVILYLPEKITDHRIKYGSKYIRVYQDRYQSFLCWLFFIRTRLEYENKDIRDKLKSMGFKAFAWGDSVYIVDPEYKQN